jgi:hypothetical protein
MFRKRDPQGGLFESSGLLPPEKAQRLEKSWADGFRRHALPLIDEAAFAPLYCEDNGRPNAPVEIVFGVLLLKAMFDLTDEEALEQLEWNLQWHHALRLQPEDAHLCQKTLHNFRARLLAHDGGRLAFEETTERILAALKIRVDRQRLDSTHILSNFAHLTRLRLFCETIRVLLRAVHATHPRLFPRVPERLRARYLRSDGSSSAYGDARTEAARRRLEVCARDVYRLHALLAGTAAAKLAEYKVLERLLLEQCDVTPRPPKARDDDDDAGERPAPVRTKAPNDVSSASLQTPHDPDVTYSGHKGKGYSVQVAETCHEDNPVEIITHVEVTEASTSDANATVPTLEALSTRGLHPEEMIADTTYGSGANAVDAERVGIELVAPVGGASDAHAEDDAAEATRALTIADFDVDTTGQRTAVCPAGHEAEREEECSEHRLKITFAKERCEACPDFARCPAKYQQNVDGFVLSVNLIQRNLERRRRAEATGEFKKRYDIRAGIEATNSELKRRHGLGRLRVRRRPRVELAVYLAALACNLKRMVRHLLAAAPEIVPQPA